MSELTLRKNLVASVALTLLAGAVAVVSAPSAAVAATNDYTRLQNLKSLYYMVRKSNDYVVQDEVYNPNGYWQRIQLSNGHYQYMNLQTKGGLGIDGASTKAGAAAYVGDYSSSAANQQWTFPRTTATSNAGWAMIKNVKSGLCLGVSSASTTAGAAVAQYACDPSAKNQAWRQYSPL
ncbi:RICIN domain-containing protein [Actinoplanes sp. NPDC049681]|uniref:RICIN domain-containing protein n=1 Tax=Actinoplanes sp. NPDC049681 TaxID=3363905 RepID=UPI0037A16987